MNQASASQRLGLKVLIILAYISVFFLLISSPWSLFWFGVGVISGMGFLLADERFLHRFYDEKPTDRFLASRSPLFLLSLMPLTVFILTSSGSYWAGG